MLKTAISQMFKIASYICVLFLLLTTVSYGQDGKVVCAGSKIEDWDNCFGTEISGRYQYEGRWIKGKKVGNFSVTSKEGDKFEMNFVNGIQSREGIGKSTDGEIYQGELLNGNKHGKGVVSRRNGVKIEGEWFNGKRNGAFIATTKEGSKLITMYKDDVAYDSSILIYPNNDILFFTNEKRSSGSVYYKNGDKYLGEVADFAENGKGLLTQFDGNVYDGYFEDRQKHGKGIFTFSSGVIFEGNWEKGKKQGPFIINSPDKSQALATYLNDRLVGKLITTTSNGDKTTIEVTDGRPDGFGKIEYKSGHIYEGNFINGKRNGKGKFTFTSGDVVFGEYKGDKRIGPFTLYKKDGQKVEAIFENDELIGVDLKMIK